MHSWDVFYMSTFGEASSEPSATPIPALRARGAHAGKAPHSEERKAKIAAAIRAKWADPESDGGPLCIRSFCKGMYGRFGLARTYAAHGKKHHHFRQPQHRFYAHWRENLSI